MEIPMRITVKTKDVGATQEATFYLNELPLVRYRTRTGHEDRSLEFAEADFRRFISNAFREHLINDGYNEHDVSLRPLDDEDRWDDF